MLSIIIPTLNEEIYLPLVLEEIKRQNVPDCEIIVADAGSTDKTVEIAKSYGCRVVPGGLPAKGRNEGAKAAKGEYLLFLDADMFSFPPNFFNEVLSEFVRKKLDIATCPICADGKKIDKLAFSVYNFWTRITKDFLPHAAQVIWVRKEIHEKVGGFDETVKFAEDCDYARRIGKIGRFGYIKTSPVLTSSRRFERDGRLKTYSKAFLAEFHMTIIGPIKSDVFKYRFNHYNEIRDKDFKNKKCRSH